MKKSIFTLLCASTLLIACSPKEDNSASSVAASQANQMACTPNNLNEQIDQILQQRIQQLTNKVNHQWIDHQKLSNIISQFHINANNPTPSENNLACTAELTIGVGSETLNLASQNAPLLQTPNPFDFITKQLNGLPIRFDGQNFVFPIQYAINNNTLTLNDNHFNQVSSVIANAILAAGIKDMIIVNGQEISKELALNQLLHPKPIAPVAPTHNETPSMETTWAEDWAEETNYSAEENGVDLQPINTPEVIQPETPANKISDNELNEARQAHHLADSAIKSAWQKIPSEIRQDLVEEQRAWENQKRQSCRSAASKGADSNERQYLQTQCDTRLTKERVQYLNGYSIE